MSDPIKQGMRRGAAAFGFLKAWNTNRKANKAERRAKREARQGLPVDEREEGPMFPENTMRKSGVAAVGASPFIGFAAGLIIRLLGVGDVCTPEAVEQGCMTVDAMATQVGAAVAGLTSVVGGALYWRGFNRAKARAG